MKQAPKAWYGRIDGFLINLGFAKSKVDSNLYYKVEDDGIMIFILYVYELLLIPKEMLISELRRKLQHNLR